MTPVGPFQLRLFHDSHTTYKHHTRLQVFLHLLNATRMLTVTTGLPLTIFNNRFYGARLLSQDSYLIIQ